MRYGQRTWHLRVRGIDILTAAAAIATALIALAVLVWLDRSAGVDHWNLVRDTNAIAGQPFYFGAFSTLTIMIWLVGATSAFLGWRLLRHLSPPSPYLPLLRVAAFYMSFAAIDDAFMFHENAHLVGLTENVFMVGHAIGMAALLISTLPVIDRTRWLTLGVSVAGFGATTVIDQVPWFMQGQIMAEEIAKFLAVLGLSIYVCAAVLQATLAERGIAPE